MSARPSWLAATRVYADRRVIAILFLGLAYVWAKGDLDWVLTYTGSPYQPPEARERVRRSNVGEIQAALESAAPEGEAEKDAEDEEAA